MNKKKNIVFELYEMLEKLRYPGLAGINFKDFESSGLVGSQRLDLLMWILKKNINFDYNIFNFNKIKENDLDSQLFEFYSSMGFTNNLECLRGSNSMEKQFNFLSFLVHFIDIFLYPNHEENSNINKENSNSNLYTEPYEDKSCFNDEHYSDYLNNLIAEESIKDISLISNNINKIQTKLVQLGNGKYTPTFETFQISFKNISQLAALNADSSLFSKFYQKLNMDIDKIHDVFTVIKKIIVNENKIKNHTIPENCVHISRPLNKDIRKNLLLAEQACNLLKENF